MECILWTDGIYLKEIPKERKPQKNSRFKKLVILAESKGLSLEKLECGIIDGCKYSVWCNSNGEALCRTLDEVESAIANEEVA